ncbi:MAG TPA: hypothetical protein VFG37_02720 [Planctomycetota bacterium]|nr:hypothetical protein [Planctomycetota bacterium]
MSDPFQPRAQDKIGAAVVALLMVGSLARSFLRTPPRAPDEGASTPADDATPTAAPATGARAWLTFEVQAEVRAGEAAPPLKLRLRTREGVAPTFDVTTRESPVKSRFSVPVALPVARPELPLRAEVLGDAWCIPPGAVEFEVRRLDVPYQLTLARAKLLDVVVTTEEGHALPGARIFHESAKQLGTTAADGRARIVRAVARDASALIAMADGFAPAWVDEGVPTVLRAEKAVGRLRGVVRDFQGNAVAGASLLPKWKPAGEEPKDPAGRALWRLAQWTARRGVPALALTSDAEGRFEVPVACAGSVTFAVQHRTLGATSATFELAAAAAAGAATDAEVRFPRRVALTVVLTLDGAPVGHGRVEVVRSEGGVATTLAAAVADAKGMAEFSAPDLPPLLLVTHGDATATHVAPLDLSGGDALRHDVALARGRGATFTFVSSGDPPVAGLPFEARDRASGVLLETAAADARGRGRFRRLPVGRALDLAAPALGPGEPLRAALVVEEGEGDLELGTFELKRN